jgi:hypothetical protein
MIICRILDETSRQIDILQIACRNLKVFSGGRDYATFSVSKTKTKTVIGDDTAIAASHQTTAIVQSGT